MTQQKVAGDIRNELELEIIVNKFDGVIIDAYEGSYPVQTVISESKGNLVRMRTEVRKYFNRTK